ncbi:MAG TPA: ribonuclease HI family protein [Acidobacteriaceae bacterium]|nr:ribonuclease HI family protein [Acidobacteriaceae bacterium]
MASLFPDEGRPSGGRAPFRKYPARPKAVQAELPPLQPGWVLAHCDGGARGNPGPAGFGAVVVDDAGVPLAELSEFLGFRTNNFAEYSGLLAVLAWALEHGHRKLRVISDSELMVKQIQGKYKVNSPDLKPLHEEARRRIGQLAGFEIHHALRHKNKVADQLANEAMDRGMGKGAGGSGPVLPAKATPYPAREKTPPVPAGFEPASRPAEAGSAMLRGFVRDGVVHLLGGKALPEGVFVKVLPE